MATTAHRKQRATGKAAPKFARHVAALARRFQRDVVRAALIDHWRITNRVSPKLFGRCTAAVELRDVGESREVAEAQRCLARFTDRLSLKDLECGFETLIDSQHRRSQGAVYTPEYVIDYLVRHALDFAATRKRTPLVCDLACGSGGFLIRAAAHFEERYGIAPEYALRQFIIGFDKDESALRNAQCVIELFLASRGSSIEQQDLQLIAADTLLTDAASLRYQAHAADGFDVVVGNPPYVKLQNLAAQYREELTDRFGPFVKGSFSLALAFLLAGQRLLAPRGCLAYITQNNLFTSLAAEPLRRQLQDAQCIQRIIDFGHAHVFPDASAYTCLVFFGNQIRTDFQFASIPTPSRQSLAAASLSQISFARLDASKWRLAEQPHMDHLRKLESTGVPLGQLARIRVGFATLRDAVFLARQCGDECIAGRNGNECNIESEFTRAAVRIADCSNERELVTHQTRVIFPYEQVDGRFRLVSETKIAKRYPKAYRYLNANRMLLDARDKGKANTEGWYAWGRAQGRAAPGPKLLTKTFETRPNFMFDLSDQLFCNGYSVSLRSGSPREQRPRLLALQRILNSSLMHYYARLTSFQIEGGYQCYQKNFIERFGVPELTSQQTERLLALPNEQDVIDTWLASYYEIPFDDVKRIVLH